MKKIIQFTILALGMLVGAVTAFAGGSSPGLYYGQVPTAAQWNSYFAAKLDYTPGSVNTISYWNSSGDLLSATVSGDCTSIANVFTCTTFNHNVTLNSKLLFSTTAPTLLSGFGTTPSIVTSNGTSVFTINVGTGGAASSGVVAMPTATTGWSCTVMPNSAPQAAAVMYAAPTSASQVTITNYTLTTGAALAWPASTVIRAECSGY